MARRRYEDVEIGDELPELKPDVSMDKVRAFCRAAGNYTPRFTDHERARKQGLDSAIVPGIMSQALLAANIHAWAEGAQVLSIDTVFRAPIPVDSHPLFHGVVTNTDEGERVVELDLTIVNEAGETRVLGTARVRL